MANLCGARRKQGKGRCRAPAKPNGRCRLHGGNLKGPVTEEGKKRSIAARIAGRARWLERRREAKALGLIDAMCCGPNRKGMGYKIEHRLHQAAKEIAMAEIAKLPAPTGKPFAEQTMGEQLSSLARLSLTKACEILSMDVHETVDAGDGKTKVELDRKLLGMQKDIALSLIATQVRVDESKMREARLDRLPAVLAAIAEIKAKTPLLVEQPIEDGWILRDEPTYQGFDE